jgi:ADP-dependent NAD(P)H-hydrate dehydratase / NAD(P)H-hydrate epimerase
MNRSPRRFVMTPDLCDLLRKEGGAHKYQHGHALVLSGGFGRSGAARLAARAALRVGAGLVTLAAPPDAMAEVACQITAIMLRQLATGADLADLLADPRLTALCVGPGFGLEDHHAALLAQALAARRPILLDADALTLLARAPALQAALHDSCVLTPHEGEFARLFPDLASGPGQDIAARAAAVAQAAARIGAVVLLKGPATLVADGQGTTVNPAATDGALAWLATAGSGDVLAGLICGLQARGIAAGQAARLGVWLHAQAARRFGPGLIAEDLPEMLPAVLAALLDQAR